MEKKAMTARRGTRLATVLVLIVALMSSLFTIMFSSAAEDDRVMQFMAKDNISFAVTVPKNDFAGKTSLPLKAWNLPEPDRPSSTEGFKGWYDEADAKKSAVTSDYTILVENLETGEAQKVFAKFDSTATYYTVTLDANDGTFNEYMLGKTNTYNELNHVSTKTLTYEKDAALKDYYLDFIGKNLIPENAPSNKKFDKWTYDKAGTQVVNSTDKVTKNTTIYAQWKDTTPTPSTDNYAINFVAEEGNEKSDVTTVLIPTTKYYSGMKIKETDIPQPNGNANKKFTGWYTYDSKGQKINAFDNGELTVQPSALTTIYAGYCNRGEANFNNFVYLSLNGVGGAYQQYKYAQTSNYNEFTSFSAVTLCVAKGAEFRSISKPTVVKSGSTLTGYSYENGTVVGNTDKIDKDMTLNAIWDGTPTPSTNVNNLYFITYKVYDAASDEWKDYAYTTVKKGDALTSTQLINNPTNLVDQNGKAVNFVGWYLDSDLKQSAPSFDGKYKLTGDLVLYARTSNFRDVTIYYNYNDRFIVAEDTSYPEGLDVDDDYINRLITDDELRRIGIDPTRSGISTTWYTDKELKNEFKSINKATGKIDVYGKAVGRQRITLNSEIGSTIVPTTNRIFTNILTINVNEDMKLANAVKDYYVTNINQKNGNRVFYYWTLKDGSATKLADETAAGHNNLYAYIGPGYKLTFDMNGGYTYGDDGETKYEAVYMDLPTHPETVADAIRDVSHFYNGNKTFLRWTYDKEGRNPIDVNSFTLVRDTTIYAQWGNYEVSDGKIVVKTIDGKKIAVRGTNSTTKATDYTGIAPEYNNDKNWWRVVNGDVVEDATGVFKNEYGWWRVEKGLVNFKANGIYKNEYGWWKTTDGKVTFKETGVFKNEFGWWRVENSKVNFKANGIYKNDYGWWKTTSGKVTFKETGIFKNENGWWRVEKSKVNFKANGIYKNDYGWWKTTNGKVTFKENGVFKNEYGWWKVENSKVNFKFTGIAKNDYGTWYLKNGKVDFTKKGNVKFDGHTYKVTNGKAKLVK